MNKETFETKRFLFRSEKHQAKKRVFLFTIICTTNVVKIIVKKIPSFLPDVKRNLLVSNVSSFIFLLFFNVLSLYLCISMNF